MAPRSRKPTYTGTCEGSYPNGSDLQGFPYMQFDAKGNCTKTISLYGNNPVKLCEKCVNDHPIAVEWCQQHNVTKTLLHEAVKEFGTSAQEAWPPFLRFKKSSHPEFTQYVASNSAAVQQTTALSFPANPTYSGPCDSEHAKPSKKRKSTDLPTGVSTAETGREDESTKKENNLTRERYSKNVVLFGNNPVKLCSECLSKPSVVDIWRTEHLEVTWLHELKNRYDEYMASKDSTLENKLSGDESGKRKRRIHWYNLTTSCKELFFPQYLNYISPSIQSGTTTDIDTKKSIKITEKDFLTILEHAKSKMNKSGSNVDKTFKPRHSAQSRKALSDVQCQIGSDLFVPFIDGGTSAREQVRGSEIVTTEDGSVEGAEDLFTLSENSPEDSMTSWEITMRDIEDTDFDTLNNH